MRTSPALAAFVSLLLGTLVHSAPLSLDDCRQLAAHQQPAVAAAEAGAAGAREAIGEARAPYYPTLDLGAGYHRWQRHAFLPSGLSLPGRPIPDLIGPLDDWNGGVSSHLTLLDFGGRRAALTAAQARAAGATAELEATRAEVRLSVDTAFFTLAAAQELETVAEKNLERTEAHRKLAVDRRDAGAVAQADVLRMDAELATARLERIDTATRVEIAAGRLNTAMGRPAGTPIAIRTDALPFAAPTDIDADAATAQALARRPELIAAGKRTAAAEAALAGARASRAPQLRADAAYGWRDTGFWPETNEWQAGLSVDLPLFDGGTRAHRIARSRADLAREQALLAQRRLEVRDEVWSAVAELKRAWAAIAANETAVHASDESLRVVRERYQRGAAVVTDLLDTQTALARAESSLAQARWNYCAARAAFDRAVATPTP